MIASPYDEPIGQAITDNEFRRVQKLVHEIAGITLPASKKALVIGRLARQLKLHGLTSYQQYFDLIESGQAEGELQTAIDLLTTNETYFFREPKHFEWLRKHAQQARARPGGLRIWSAASSSGEEAYSIAMLLEDCIPSRWEVVGTDISTRMVQSAQRGLYPRARTTNIPVDYLKRFCLKGTGTYEGTVLVNARLRKAVTFLHGNLNAPLPNLGAFDVVFLRNVMIYFNAETRREVVTRVLALIKPGGHLLIGHSETLHDVTTDAKMVAPAVYLKPGQKI